MRERFAFSVVMVLTFAASLLASCKGESAQSRYLSTIPEDADVQLVEVDVYPMWEHPPLPLVPEMDGARIHWLLLQLRTGKLQSESVETITLHSDLPTFIVYSGGTESIRVFPAYNCARDGQETRCHISPTHVGASLGEGMLRVRVPNLAKWFSSDWPSDLRTGTNDEHDRILNERFRLVSIPRTEDVSTLSLSQGGLLRPEPPPLDSDFPNDRETIAKVLNWLREAEPVTSTGEIISPSNTATIQAGRSGGLRISDSWQCTHTATSTSCEPDPGVVIVSGWNPYGPAPASLYFRSPALAQWIRMGWRADFEVETNGD